MGVITDYALGRQLNHSHDVDNNLLYLRKAGDTATGNILLIASTIQGNNLIASINAGTTQISQAITLPDQSGHAGEFLETNGTIASWQAIPSTGVINQAITTADTSLHDLLPHLVTPAGSVFALTTTIIAKAQTFTHTRLYDTALISDASLVSYWLLDGNSTDVKGVSNGTDTNITYAAALFGQGATGYDGVTSKINVGNAVDNPAGDMTVSAWVYITAIGTSGTIFFKGDGLPGTGHEDILFAYDTAGKLFFFNTLPGGVGPSDTPLIAGQWNHVAMTWSGPFCSFFVNGHLAYTRSTGRRTGPLTDAFIGSRQDGTDPVEFIDDVSFFSRALTEAEIESLCPSFNHAMWQLSCVIHTGLGDGTQNDIVHVDGLEKDVLYISPAVSAFWDVQILPYTDPAYPSILVQDAQGETVDWSARTVMTQL